MRSTFGLQLALLALACPRLDGEGDPSGTAVADDPAAPPAPPAPPEPLHPQEDRLSAVQKATADLRARFARGEVGFTPPEGEQPKEDEGTEPTTPPAAPLSEGTPPAEAAGSEGSGEAAEAATDFSIDLPPRREGGEPITLQVPDQETAEALRMMRNGFMRGEEVRRARDEIAQAQAEFKAFQHYAQVDPVGLVLEHLPPESHRTLAEHLLAQPGVLEAVLEKIESWQDPNVRRADAAEMDRDRTKRSGDVQREMQAHAFNQRVTNTVVETVERLMTLVPGEFAQVFRDDALGDIASHFRREAPRGLPTPEQLAGVLERRLKLMGVPKERVAAALSDHPNPDATPQPRPKGAAAEALATQAQGKTVDGRKLVQASATRKAVAAATPGAGAGSSATRVQPPKGLKLTGGNTIFDFLRQNVLGKAAPR